jgi:hypothetical protein
MRQRKITAGIRAGSTPCRMRSTKRPVTVLVLPGTRPRQVTPAAETATQLIRPGQ